MEGDGSILGAIYEDDDNLDDDDDVEMVDIEEGELVDNDLQITLDKNDGEDTRIESKEPLTKNHTNEANKEKKKKKKKSKKRKRKMNGLGSNFTDINRFVLDACRHLKEKKSYMVYNAVGCLGVSALSDLIKEVDAVQACGGQMTSDGRRFRNGGGILWNIIKLREPNAYKEIMKKAKEFEKQFRGPNIRQAAARPEKESCDKDSDFSDGTPSTDVVDSSNDIFSQPDKLANSEEKRVSVHDRIRVPVLYDDELLSEGPNSKGLEPGFD